MIINNTNGKPINFIETLISNDCVITINATRQAATYDARPEQRAGKDVNVFRYFAVYTVKN